MQWLILILVAYNIYLTFLVVALDREKNYAVDQAEQILANWWKASRKNAEAEIKLMEERDK